jgi:hypothetical protein
MAVSRPEPGPLTKTSTLRMPCSMARRAAASAAICAANGVDLREPLKPTWPAEAQEITAPVGSVIEMIVLLNVLLMWACPLGDVLLLLAAHLLGARSHTALGRHVISSFLRGLRVWRERSELGAGYRGFRGRSPRRGFTCRPSSCRRRCAWGPCGCARWSWCAGRERAGHDGAAGPRRTRSRPCGGCPRHLTAQVTFDLEVVVDPVTQLDEVGVGEVLDAGVRVDPGGREGLLRAGATHSEDVGQCDLDALLAREVHSD